MKTIMLRIILGLGMVGAAAMNLFSQRQTFNKVMLITIPKSGTHLVEKCLCLMNPEVFNYDYNETFNFEKRWERNKDKNHTPPNHWRGDLRQDNIINIVAQVKKSIKKDKTAYKGHMYYSHVYNDFLDMHQFNKILLLRDPRAVLVSFANMVKDGFEPDHKIDFQDLLLDLIDARQKHYAPWASSKHTAYPLIWDHGICEFYRWYLPFMETKNCLVLRFEDLVGEKGGGSNERQLSAIRLLAKHVRVSLDSTQVQNIIENLFGGSATFNQGSIDGWKKYFNDEVKMAFKNMAGANELLIELGYEKNANW